MPAGRGVLLSASPTPAAAVSAQVGKQVVKPPTGAPGPPAADQHVVLERLKAPNMLGAFTSYTRITYLR